MLGNSPAAVMSLYKRPYQVIVPLESWKVGM